MPTPPSRRSVAVLAALSLAALPLTLATGPAEAVTARHYKNCTALNKVYPHGVGRKGASDHTSGTKVKNFTVNTKVYGMNNGPRNASTGEYDLDRDNDGIACEKR